MNLEKFFENKPFYASEVIYGGGQLLRILEILIREEGVDTNGTGIGGSIDIVTNNITAHDNFQNMTSELLDISKKMETIVGGNEAFYNKPIIDLLDDLKNQILEFLVKKFSKVMISSGITTHSASVRNLRKDPIIVDDLSNIFRELTSNPSQCQIFASIMNQDDCINSLRVDYVDENSPVFVCPLRCNFDIKGIIDNILNEIPLLKMVYSIINMDDNKPRLLKVKWNNNIGFNIIDLTSLLKDNSKKLMLCEDVTFRSILETVSEKIKMKNMNPLLINIMNGCE
ncbi:hypothetical protein C2G38_2225791 [Gigaspora rosea]|uniref:Uncharacterized protein n=1 Tax=Gigaspora rosea TaxID=44941 RepID=A0A397U0K7_9GLOM|nr:hypothetical protein C2G38_2225791 [Gigaspora rosea]